MRSSKTHDLQPWVDYFNMLQSYIRHGYMEVKPDSRELFITRSALLTLSPPGALGQEKAILNTIKHLRVYMEYLSVYKIASKPAVKLSDNAVHTIAKDATRTKKVFAVHIVGEEPPYPLLKSLLIVRKRSWRHLFLITDKIISYE